MSSFPGPSFHPSFLSWWIFKFPPEKNNWSRVDHLHLLLITPVMILGTVSTFLKGICNHPPRLRFEGDPHGYINYSRRLVNNSGSF
ncbi:hypothetical protein AMECASPLE_008778 [Ameca splendens]|uniref:Uncharacterized protein n=1 Tax=Ameca splendens TaxID=208324 RepID=A0ABV0XP00_9TELE